MIIPESSPATFKQDLGFVMFRDLTENLIRICFFCHCPKRDFNDLIFTGSASAERFATWSAVAGFQVLGELQVEKRPELFVAFEDDVCAASTVATIRTTLGDVFGTVQVG